MPVALEQATAVEGATGSITGRLVKRPAKLCLNGKPFCRTAIEFLDSGSVTVIAHDDVAEKLATLPGKTLVTVSGPWSIVEWQNADHHLQRDVRLIAEEVWEHA